MGQTVKELSILTLTSTKINKGLKFCLIAGLCIEDLSKA